MLHVGRGRKSLPSKASMTTTYIHASAYVVASGCCLWAKVGSLCDGLPSKCLLQNISLIDSDIAR